MLAVFVLRQGLLPVQPRLAWDSEICLRLPRAGIVGWAFQPHLQLLSAAFPFQVSVSVSSLSNPREDLSTFLVSLLPLPLGTPVCADLADLPSVSGHGSVERGAPSPVRLVGVGSSLQEAAGSSWPRESGSQVQGRLSSAHCASLGAGTSIQQRVPGFGTSQPLSLYSCGLPCSTKDC